MISGGEDPFLQNSTYYTKKCFYISIFIILNNNSKSQAWRAYKKSEVITLQMLDFSREYTSSLAHLLKALVKSSLKHWRSTIHRKHTFSSR